MFIDTHCHLDMILLFPQQERVLDDKDLPAIGEIITRAQKQQVATIINVGCNIISSYNSLFLAQKFTNVFATVGLHPTECNVGWQKEFAELKELIAKSSQSKLVAIGEIGLDYYHKPYNSQMQKDALMAQIELALSLDLPVSLHVREAGDDILKLIEPYRKNNLRGVMHCFQQSASFAKTATDWGFYLGVDGPIDYPKNQGLRDIFKNVGLQHLILETDAPFLPPQAFRGKPNEPAYVPYIAQALAEIFATSPGVIADVTTQNAEQLFKIANFNHEGNL